MILLYHEATDGTITTSSKLVAGEAIEPRRYQHNGHFVEIDGPDHVVAHDADDICKIPGYRLATPEECDSYYAGKRKAQSVSETADSSAKKSTR